MNILLTNDDGINALGILKLEKLLSKYGNVFIVAPSTCQSGKSCSINAHFGVEVNKIDDKHYAVNGSPVDCVEIACSLLPVKFDLVVSGCNDGYNLAQDIMYSGTCGACVQALLAKKKAIAISCACKEQLDVLDEYFYQVFDYILSNKLLSNKYFLNVNFPLKENYKGIKITKIVEPIYEQYSYEISNNKYIVKRNLISKNKNKSSDIVSCFEGYVSITPLSQTIFKESNYKKLVSKK